MRVKPNFSEVAASSISINREKSVVFLQRQDRDFFSFLSASAENIYPITVSMAAWKDGWNAHFLNVIILKGLSFIGCVQALFSLLNPNYAGVDNNTINVLPGAVLLEEEAVAPNLTLRSNSIYYHPDSDSAVGQYALKLSQLSIDHARFKWERRLFCAVAAVLWQHSVFQCSRANILGRWSLDRQGPWTHHMPPRRGHHVLRMWKNTTVTN